MLSIWETAECFSSHGYDIRAKHHHKEFDFCFGFSSHGYDIRAKLQ